MDGQGIGEALVSLVAVLLVPGSLLVEIACYVIGGVVFLQALLRLMRSGEEGLRGPSGAGTALTFLVAIVFLTFPQWLEAWGHTLFGETGQGAAASLAYARGERSERYELMLWAVFKVVQFVGLFSFLRGVFVLRDSAEGRNGATAGKAFAHIVGGVCGWHILWVIDRVQNTLGIAPLNISEG